MNNVIIKTPYECLIKTEDEQTLLDENESLVLLPPFSVCIYPVNKAISFILASDNLQTCEFYDVANYKQDTLICLKKTSTCENYSIVNISGCKLEIGERKFTIESEDWKKTILLPCSFDRYQTSVKNNIIMIKFIGKKQVLYAFNKKTAQAHAFSGNKIDFNQEGFSVEEHNINKSYKISNQGLSGSNNEEAACPLPQTLAYHFLEYIKKADLSSAHNLLSQNLQQNISKQALKTFFGSIKSVFYLSPVCYAVQNEKGLKIYNFEVKQDKICDISD